MIFLIHSLNSLTRICKTPILHCVEGVLQQSVFRRLKAFLLCNTSIANWPEQPIVILNPTLSSNLLGLLPLHHHTSDRDVFYCPTLLDNRLNHTLDIYQYQNLAVLFLFNILLQHPPLPCSLRTTLCWF